MEDKKGLKSVLNSIMRFMPLVIVFAIMATLTVTWYLNTHMQAYTTSAVIVYNNAEGENPDGSKIDTSEIYSANIVYKAMKDINYDGNVDQVRNSISVTDVIATEDQEKYNSKIENGEDAELIKNKFLITLSCSKITGKDFSQNLLTAILNEYIEYYEEEYGGETAEANNTDNIINGKYDYIEKIELIDDSVGAAMDDLTDKIAKNDDFRSTQTGYTFSDIYNEFEFYKNNKIPSIEAMILADNIVEDRSLLLSEYKSKNSTLSTSKKTDRQKYKRTKKIIDKYVDMMEDSENVDLESEDITDDVDNTNRTWTSDKTTDYDDLLEKYVKGRISCAKDDIEIAHNEYIMSCFKKGTKTKTSSKVVETNKEIKSLGKHLNKIYGIYEKTIADYNRYVGAQRITIKSTITTSEKLPIKKLSIAFGLLFFIIGILGLIVGTRVYDIFFNPEFDKDKKQDEECNDSEDDKMQE